MLAVITGEKTASPQRQVYIAAIVDQVSWMGSPLINPLLHLRSHVNYYQEILGGRDII